VVHGDLNMGNIIVTSKGEISFIDFGLFGFAYYLLDVSMGPLIMVPSEHRFQHLHLKYKGLI
jgi:aminoglycoside phosphotransferase (APT) family kinase protein